MGNDNTDLNPTEIKKCKLCHHFPTAGCTWKQGRCPHVPSVFDMIMTDSHKTRFYLLINKIKSLFK
jgi:hypothetical protein